MDSTKSSKFKSGFWCFSKRHAAEEHEAHEANCTALCCAKPGECACVTQLLADHDEAERLRDMGIYEGVTVKVLRDGDPLIVRVGECRLGLGRTAATKIICELVS
jgi:Fe2+ transport system protein FeoA